ncbi:hypothetical protein TNCV_2331501 [Trichonephila clavipes]|nr:hypothetical protein TNCV_2331501 [Trichonephila clavipes]
MSTEVNFRMVAATFIKVASGYSKAVMRYYDDTYEYVCGFDMMCHLPITVDKFGNISMRVLVTGGIDLVDQFPGQHGFLI